MTIRRHLVGLLALGALIFTAGESDAATPPEAALSEEPYMSKGHGFSIRFPEGWQVKGSTVPTTIIKARLKDEGAPITYLAIATHPASRAADPLNVSAQQLFQECILAGSQELIARITESGEAGIGGRRAVWMEIDIESPAFLSQYALVYFFPGEDKILRVSGATKRDLAWFAQVKPLFKASIESIMFMEAASLNTMPLHTDARYGFSVRLPDDWVKKEALTEETILKAVKRFADGTFLMLAVSTQLLRRADPTVEDMSDEELFLLAKETLSATFGAEIELLGIGRGDIHGRPSAQAILEVRHPQLRPKVMHRTYVINDRHLYTIMVGGDKSLYPEHAEQMKQIGNSFTFTTPPSGSNPEHPGTTPARTLGEILDEGSSHPESPVVVFEPGDPWPTALLKGFGVTFLKLFAIGIGFAIAGTVWAKIRRKARRKRAKEASPQSDETPEGPHRPEA